MMIIGVKQKDALYPVSDSVSNLFDKQVNIYFLIELLKGKMADSSEERREIISKKQEIATFLEGLGKVVASFSDKEKLGDLVDRYLQIRGSNSLSEAEFRTLSQLKESASELKKAKADVQSAKDKEKKVQDKIDKWNTNKWFLFLGGLVGIFFLFCNIGMIANLGDLTDAQSKENVAQGKVSVIEAKMTTCITEEKNKFSLADGDAKEELRFLESLVSSGLSLLDNS